MINLGKQWSSTLTRLVDLAVMNAEQSPLQIRHGAVLFGIKGRVIKSSCNQQGHRVCGFNVPSLHAEANCVQSLHTRQRYQGRSHEEEG
jgi:hypothetical protein